MNVTKNEKKDRRLHNEGYQQMISAEQREYAEASVYSKITKNNDTITDFQTDRLMEQILQSDNLNKAYKKVKSNKRKPKAISPEDKRWKIPPQPSPQGKNTRPLMDWIGVMAIR